MTRGVHPVLMLSAAGHEKENEPSEKQACRCDENPGKLRAKPDRRLYLRLSGQFFRLTDNYAR